MHAAATNPARHRPGQHLAAVHPPGQPRRSSSRRRRSSRNGPTAASARRPASAARRAATPPRGARARRAHRPRPLRGQADVGRGRGAAPRRRRRNVRRLPQRRHRRASASSTGAKTATSPDRAGLIGSSIATDRLRFDSAHGDRRPDRCLAIDAGVTVATVLRDLAESRGARPRAARRRAAASIGASPIPIRRRPASRCRASTSTRAQGRVLVFGESEVRFLETLTPDERVGCPAARLLPRLPCLRRDRPASTRRRSCSAEADRGELPLLRTARGDAAGDGAALGGARSVPGAAGRRPRRAHGHPRPRRADGRRERHRQERMRARPRRPRPPAGGRRCGGAALPRASRS